MEMDALLLVLASGAALLVAYFTFGRWLSDRVFRLDDANETPAHTECDGRDYCPTRKSIIFGHHFTSIAGTGPIVGPAIAVMWGWLPAILWVVLGSIFVGAVHDLGAIVVSLRNKGRSIGDVAGDLLGPRARFVFLSILIVGLWIVLAVFGLVIAAVLRQYPAAIFPVLVQIPLAIVIGLLVHRRGGAIAVPSVIALGLMYLSVVFGDVGWLHTFNTALAAQPLWMWTVGLLAYAYIASVLPVWVLLQPRDYINALQLISTLVLIVAGLFAAAAIGGAADSGRGFTTETTEITEGELGLKKGGTQASAPDSTPSSSSVPSVPSVVQSDSPQRPRLELVAPMIDWQPEGAPPMLPLLFITIACGACSGFHCLVGSGTTSKQIGRERDARAVGYGSMLTEGFLATLVIAACAGGIGLGVTTESRAWGLDAMWRFSRSSLVVNDGANRYIVEYHLERSRLPWPSPQLRTGEDEPTTFVKVPSYRYFHDMRVSVDGRGSWTPRHDLPLENAMIFRTKDGSIITRRLPIVDSSIATSHRLQLTGRFAFNKQYESWSAAGGLARTVGAFVEGAANFVASLGIPLNVAIALMGVMVASFAATTMDTACRLQRYVVQELAGTFVPRLPAGACVGCGYDMRGIGGEGTVAQRHEGTKGGEGGEGGDASGVVTCPECGVATDPGTLCASVPLCLRASPSLASPWNPCRYLATTHGATIFAVVSALFLAFIPPAGAAWSLGVAGKGGLILWPLFGATNQLLAGFAFVVITAWLIATKRPWWFAIVPGVFMLIVPAWAMVWQAFIGNEANASWMEQGSWVLVAVGSVTLALEAWLLVEVGMRWVGRKPGSVFRP